MRKFISIVILTFLVFVSCNPSEGFKTKDSSEALFELKTSEETGLNFVNASIQNTQINVLGANYASNTGGLAVGDFNNDGLEDVYLTGNQVADRVYLNKGNLQFEDITNKTGIKPEKIGQYITWSTGVTITDINQDGWKDIYVCKAGPFSNSDFKKNKLYINNKDLTFTERAEEYGIADVGSSVQAVFFDIDKDNDLDLYVSNYSSIFNLQINKLQELLQNPEFVKKHTGNMYLNTGEQFEKITIEAGVSSYGFGLGPMASDLNEDGLIDLYVSNDFSRPDKMFINQGDNTFLDEISTRTKHISYYGMGTEITDINNDGLPEIGVLDMAGTSNFRSKTFMPSMQPETFHYLHDELGAQYQYMFNSLQLNNGNGTFSDIARIAGVEKSDWSWGILFADFDNDGYKDCIISNGNRYLADNDFWVEFRKEKQENKGNFSEERKKYWLSQLKTSRVENRIYKNKGDFTFKKINKEWGVTGETCSNSMAYADFDNDGDLDLIINNVDEPISFYENKTTGNNYLRVKLTVDKKSQLSHSSNARVYIYYGKEMQMNELIISRGFQSAVEEKIHFGLKNISKIDSLIVKWADGTRQKLEDIAVNKVLSIDKTDESTQIKRDNEIITNRPLLKEVNNFNAVRHQENEFNDFEKEILLPHKNSQHGPALAVADVNKDGFDDYFIGGAKGQAATLMLQNDRGEFFEAKSQPWSKDKNSEDTGGVFLDYDNDGDLDLYVASGGNEYEPNSPDLQDRLYINESTTNKIVFKKAKGVLPTMLNSSSCVVSLDYNKDGNIDLFIGSRMIPGRYPYPDESHLLKNEGGRFVDVTAQVVPDLSKWGIINAVTTADLNEDGFPELVLAGEWSAIKIIDFTKSVAEDITPDNLANNFGWWSALSTVDIDSDGDMDILAGNLGLNYKYKASEAEPFHIYANDFDKSGNIDIVLSYHSQGNQYPLRGRECSSQQMPMIEKQFPTYTSFASATLDEIYGENLSTSYHKIATNFTSQLFINEGNGKFTIQNFPNEAQVSSVNAFVTQDLNEDGLVDIILGGNLFASEPETPRNDGSIGLVLINNGGNSFMPLKVSESGFYVPKDMKDLKLINIRNNEFGIIAANNNDENQLFILSN